MKHLFHSVLIILFSFGLGHAVFATQQTITDDVKREVTLNIPVKRVVTFNKYNTEFFRAVGGQSILVGMAQDTNKLTNYWPGLSKNVIAGQNQREPNYEKIVALKPDLVVFPRNGAWEKAAEKLKQFDIPVVVITGWDVLKHTNNIDLIGKLTGKSNRASQLNALHKKYTDMIADRLNGVQKRTIYLEKTVNYTTSVPGSGWHDMLVQAGAKNIFDDIDIAKQPKSKGNKHQLSIDPESILRRNPDIIVKQIGTDFVPPSQEKMAKAIQDLKKRPAWSELNAVKQERVYIMSYFIAGGISKLIGKLYIAKWLYPEKFQDVNPDQVAKEWIETFQGVKYPGSHTYSG